LTAASALPAASATNNRYYVVVSVGGTGTAPAPAVVLAAPDMLLSNGTAWQEIDVSTTVSAQTASNISFTPTGAIASNNVQTALAELDTEKLAVAGGTVTGELLIGAAGSLVFEGTTADGFETTIAVVDPTADRTITLPNVTGTVITTGDSGTVTSTMILDGTIVNADINASAAIADTKLATIATALKVSNSATTAASANTASAIVARDGSGNFTAGTITAALTGAASSNVLKAGDTMTGPLITPLGSDSVPSITFTDDLNTGIYSPGADQVAISTNGTERARIDSSGRLLVGTPTSRVSYLGANAYNPDFQVESNALAGFSLSRFQTAASAPIFNVQKARGTTASPSVVALNDLCGTFVFSSYDGSKFVNAASIQAAVDGTPGTDDMPGRLVFSTTSDGSASPVERLRIDNAGTTTLTSAAATAPFIAKVSTTEAARIDSSGRLLVGTSTARNVGSGAVSGVLSLEHSAGFLGLSSARNSADSVGSILALGKSRGTTAGAFTIVNANDVLGQIRFAGADGVNLQSQGAAITAEVDGTPGNADMPGRLVFSTTADGSASPTEALRISSNRAITVSDGGNVVLGTTTGTKIGTATTQKLGFFDKTPVVQPTAVADATDAATVITQLNALLTRMRNLGLIAT
jgi:hypothetical protein